MNENTTTTRFSGQYILERQLRYNRASLYTREKAKRPTKYKLTPKLYTINTKLDNCHAKSAVRLGRAVGTTHRRLLSAASRGSTFVLTRCTSKGRAPSKEILTSRNQATRDQPCGTLHLKSPKLPLRLTHVPTITRRKTLHAKEVIHIKVLLSHLWQTAKSVALRRERPWQVHRMNNYKVNFSGSRTSWCYLQ